MNETLSMIKDCQLPERTDEHKGRVVDFLNLPSETPDIKLDGILKQLLANNGFRMFVSREDVFKKFKYHTGVNGSYRRTVVTKKGNETLKTVGSLMGLGATITLASMFVIKLIINSIDGIYFIIPAVIFFAGIFSIFLGDEQTAIKISNYTGDIPDFAIDNAEKLKVIPCRHRITIHSMEPLPTAERFVKVDPVMIAWVKPMGNKYGRYEVGVVIAIWDGDKEVSIL